MSLVKRFRFARDFRAELSWMARNAKLRFASCIDIMQEETLESIKYGSNLTGAPGQPVKTERLRKSWKPVRKNQWAFDIMSNVPYAEIIETNARGATLRSPVGGFHSVEITMINFMNIGRYALEKSKRLHPDG